MKKNFLLLALFLVLAGCGGAGGGDGTPGDPAPGPNDPVQVPLVSQPVNTQEGATLMQSDNFQAYAGSGSQSAKIMRGKKFRIVGSTTLVGVTARQKKGAQ